MTVNELMLQPVVVLVAWSMVMWLWMYSTRIPAIQKYRIKLDPMVPSSELSSKLPANVRWKADNYNHLMEQPTIFYALAISLALMGQQDMETLVIAWIYVVLRIIHSFIQVSSNVILRRFAVFALSNVALFALTIDALMIVFKI